MPKSGLFITLYDKDTLNLYLDKGIYSFLMPPVRGEINPQSRHYHALGDYACVREGTHIFFFLKRKIIYGGQAIGSKTYGSFYLNGQFSPLGKRADARLCWDESNRSKYSATDKPGVFNVPEVGERCQPYLIIFRDNLGLRGKAISSDQLYWELGKHSYPLPSNTITGMGFCTLTPGETEIGLSLLEKESILIYNEKSSDEISLEGKPKIFNPQYGIKSLKKAIDESFFVSEAHLEAFVLANPNLLPSEILPDEEYTLCRQVPMSPLKPPRYLDKANICIYSEPLVNDGTLPNVIIELKTKRVGKANVGQVCRYLRWLYRILDSSATNTKIYLYGPSFTRTAAKYIPAEYENQIKLVEI